MAEKIEPIKLIVCIVNRGKAERITELCLAHSVALHLTMLGRGTADSKVKDYLGLGETEKDIALVCVKKSVEKAFMEELTDMLKLAEAGNGIAFSIPLSSVAERGTLNLLSGFSVKGDLA